MRDKMLDNLILDNHRGTEPIITRVADFGRYFAVEKEVWSWLQIVVAESTLKVTILWKDVPEHKVGFGWKSILKKSASYREALRGKILHHIMLSNFPLSIAAFGKLLGQHRESCAFFVLNAPSCAKFHFNDSSIFSLIWNLKKAFETINSI